MIARNQQKLEQAEASTLQCAKAANKRILIKKISFDLSTPFSPEAYAPLFEALASVPDVSIVVNNAGIGNIEPIVAIDYVSTNDLINVNVVASVMVTRFLVDGMLKREREGVKGAVIFTNGLPAITRNAYLSAYAGSKAFIVAFAEAMNKEIGDKIDVFCATAGGVATKDWHNNDTGTVTV